jgi:hypothetical protein
MTFIFLVCNLKLNIFRKMKVQFQNNNFRFSPCTDKKNYCKVFIFQRIVLSLKYHFPQTDIDIDQLIYKIWYLIFCSLYLLYVILNCHCHSPFLCHKKDEHDRVVGVVTIIRCFICHNLATAVVTR